MTKQKRTDKKITKASRKERIHTRLNENCKGCIYDGNEKGDYFCLSCTLIGKYIPHKEGDKNE